MRAISKTALAVRQTPVTEQIGSRLRRSWVGLDSKWHYWRVPTDDETWSDLTLYPSWLRPQHTDIFGFDIYNELKKENT
jgi:hypothetical protein